MKRANDKKIAPGVWSGIGGRMEPNEINDPLAACYREIEEESGITPDKITSLELLYIITRRRRDEIIHIYIYFGETTESVFGHTDEGDLYWIPEKELLEREYSNTYTAMLKHYMSRKPEDRAVYVGVAGNDGGRLKMAWSKCEDFE
jgi:8-oxo-dGTP diphosphatase